MDGGLLCGAEKIFLFCVFLYLTKRVACDMLKTRNVDFREEGRPVCRNRREETAVLDINGAAWAGPGRGQGAALDCADGAGPEARAGAALRAWGRPGAGGRDFAALRGTPSAFVAAASAESRNVSR